MGAGVVLAASLATASADAASLSENFDDYEAPGWLVKNNSTSPSGTFGWGFGNSSAFPAFNGAPHSYVAAGYQSTTAVSGATISNWLMTPRMFGLSEGDTISFYTRKVSASYPDRLDVRMSTNGSCDPGTSEADVGDFETLLLSINPTLVTGGYPFVWTRYEVTLPPMTPGRGCIGFRYFVTNAGSSAPNSDYIGIDQVDVVDRDGDITPDTTIATGASGTVGPDGAAFTYAGTPSDGVASYECRLISADEPDPELASCPTAGREYEDLAAGEYTFEVRAVSVDGNVDPTPATREFTVDTAAPNTSIGSGPEGVVGSADATFTYAGDPSEDVAGFDCRLTLEGATPATFAACPSAGRDFADLADGTYLFEVRAVDAAGNADPSPATRTFTVDTTAPDTSISGGPEGLVGSADASFAFAGTPAGDVDGLECRLRSVADDDPTFVGCDSPTAQAYADLADGTYLFEVRATDAAGNADPTPATREFTVDTTAPTVTIASGPEPTSTATTAVFAYAASPSEDVEAVECRLVRPDDADPAFGDCADDAATYEGLAVGAYRFELRARDAAGNVSEVADWSFNVEAPPVEERPVEEPPVAEPPGPTAEDPPSAPPAPFVPPARNPGLPIAPPGPPANPQVSGLRLERTTFRAATSGPAFGPTGASVLSGGRGTWLRFGLDRAARIELRISRKVKRRWLPQRGVVTRSVPRGTIRIPVRGRFRGVTLRPGRYRLSVTLVDPDTGVKTTELRQFRIRR